MLFLHQLPFKKPTIVIILFCLTLFIYAHYNKIEKSSIQGRLKINKNIVQPENNVNKIEQNVDYEEVEIPSIITIESKKIDSNPKIEKTAEPKKERRLLDYVEFDTFSKDKTVYLQQCENLFKRLRYPKSNLLFKSPPEKLPEDVNLQDAFTDFGNMPIRDYRYYNNMALDAVVPNQDEKNLQIITMKELQDIQYKALNNIVYGIYGDTLMNEYFAKYNEYVKDKNCLVIGGIDPWIEALALLNKASQITTLDYTLKKYENPNMLWLHVNSFLDRCLKEKQYEQFSFSASFSSIEHRGLGRFGDPLSPYGDLEAVQKVHCLLKPGGIFFLGLPCSADNSSYMEFNAHRIYGTNRLNLILKDWTLIEQRRSNVNDHIIFVLRKN